MQKPSNRNADLIQARLIGHASTKTRTELLYIIKKSMVDQVRACCNMGRPGIPTSEVHPLVSYHVNLLSPYSIKLPTSRDENVTQKMLRSHPSSHDAVLQYERQKPLDMLHCL